MSQIPSLAWSVVFSLPPFLEVCCAFISSDFAQLPNSLSSPSKQGKWDLLQIDDQSLFNTSSRTGFTTLDKQLQLLVVLQLFSIYKFIWRHIFTVILPSHSQAPKAIVCFQCCRVSTFLTLDDFLTCLSKPSKYSLGYYAFWDWRTGL